MDLADKVLEHGFGHREVSDNAIFQRTHGDDIAGRAPKHEFRFGTYGRDRARTAGTAILADRDHRGLIEHDALATHIDQGVRGSEIDRQIGRKKTAQLLQTKHGQT